jgi:aerobic C4-dicarboxylate transport protein
VAPDAAKGAKWLADAFIQLIQTITGPVIFVTVVVGIASLGSLARVGGLALRALAYFLTMTVIALVLGLIVANVVKPGAGFAGAATEAGRTAAQASIKEAGGDSGFVSFITGSLLPDSFLGPFVENDILKVLVLAIVTAAATMVIAKWQGERDDERFQAALQDPSTVEELTERALRGEEVSDMLGRRTGRFEREQEPVASA